MSINWETFYSGSPIEVADTIVDIRKDFTRAEMSLCYDILTQMIDKFPQFRGTKVEGYVLASKLLMMYAKVGLLKTGHCIQVDPNP
ncbi:hypothetical protein C4577_01975 [Candidatus Parcubacteria bacterium]|nr:MAG: hypothetical protein C4577_01975 [Candidatus Parcubacteria bacterium]